MISSYQRLPNSTVVLTLNIPWGEIEKIWKKTFKSFLQNVEIPGFRKGKAPQKLAKEKVDKGKITQTVLSQVLPSAYTQALAQHHLRPIAPPKIEAQTLGEGKDWRFKITVALKPKVILGNYKEEIKRAKKPTPKIWTPKGERGEQKENPLDRVIKILLKTVKVELSDLLVERETERLLAQTLEEIKKLGLTLNSYLLSVGKTPEILRKESRKKAEENLKLEFILAEIAEREKIEVEEQEIEDFIKKSPDRKTQSVLKNQRYYLASLLRKRKTLDFLLNL